VLINLLIELYEKGIDYVDLFSNNDDPHQDKLIILTKDEYINPEFMKDGIRPNIKDNSEDYKEYVDDEDDNKSPKNPPTIEIKKLTDDDIDKLS
jgi:hypothetical protein